MRPWTGPRERPWRPVSVPAHAAPAAVARFVTGLDEAFARARQSARWVALFARLPGSRTREHTLRSVDELLARYSPVIATTAGSAPALAVELARTGVAATSLVDAAIHSLDGETPQPSAQTGVPKSGSDTMKPLRPALIVGSTSLGLAVLAHPSPANQSSRSTLARARRPSPPRRAGRDNPSYDDGRDARGLGAGGSVSDGSEPCRISPASQSQSTRLSTEEATRGSV